MEDTTQEASSSSGTQHHPEKNTLMAILAYIGPLIIISYLLAKDDPFVKFHIKQGLLLVIGEVATWMVMTTVWVLFPLLQLVNLAILVLAIIGIVRAAQGQEKELPLIGHWAKSFHF
ncbi:MAG TPA: DUF4870 domain-containing protein [Candidatus Paceibacterota bacterium]|nr:DUF4870 domain-containing protein [Candidatus Paceibacterota bacterium]